MNTSVILAQKLRNCKRNINVLTIALVQSVVVIGGMRYMLNVFMEAYENDHMVFLMIINRKGI